MVPSADAAKVRTRGDTASVYDTMFSKERMADSPPSPSLWDDYRHLVLMSGFAGSLYYSFFYLGALIQFMPSFIIGAFIGGLFGVAGTCYFLAKFGIRYFMTFSERLGEEILDRIGNDISDLRSSGVVSKVISMIFQQIQLERLRRSASPSVLQDRKSAKEVSHPAGTESVQDYTNRYRVGRPECEEKARPSEMDIKTAEDIYRNGIFENQKDLRYPGTEVEKKPDSPIPDTAPAKTTKHFCQCESPICRAHRGA